MRSTPDSAAVLRLTSMPMEHVRDIARMALRFAVVWVVDILSLLAAAALFPGIVLQATGQFSQLEVTVAAALLLGAINLVVRPLILLLALPLGFYVIFAAGFLANAVVLQVTAAVLPGFSVGSWLDAAGGALLLAAINTILTSLITLDYDDSFYQHIVEQLAKRQPYRAQDLSARGLVMLEIDGLSYHHMRKAIAEGFMPTLKAMIDEEGYTLSRVDCGLPSQTSACQAGILFGDNDDIPAFRWYDKDLHKLIVSSTDAPLLNARYAHGRGLLRGGSSINNMLDGDAEKSILTLAGLNSGSREQRRRRADDVYLLMLNPYFLTRTVVLLLADVLRELWQGWKQRVRNVQPRLNRLANFYPLVRAVATVFMRDVSAYLAALEIVRGTPALYTTWLGYDEVAHHCGPWTSDALDTLRPFDRTIARIRELIASRAPRPYELIVLSDHGQSFGATFKMRYGYDLKTFIERHLPQGTTVGQLSGGDDGSLSVAAMAAELDNVQAQGVGGNMGRVLVHTAQQVLTQTSAARGAGEQPKAHVMACGSGNLAQVYFDLYPRKIRLSELNAAYPGMVDALVQHDGIGFVVAYEDDYSPVCFGKRGARNLRTGKGTGQDPLAPYGDLRLRAEQVQRVADFPHAGDLMVVSTLYPDGTVAALEELIGSHGGIGGEQTDAFLFHLPEWHVPQTTNAVDVFAMLNARRGLPAAPKPAPQPERAADAWSPQIARGGLRDMRRWLGLAARAAMLDRSAYRVVVRDAALSASSLVVGLSGAIVASLVLSRGVNLPDLLARIAVPPLLALLIFVVGGALGSQASFARALRGVGFAQSAQVLQLLVFVPSAAPLARFLTLVLLFFATWTGGAEAEELNGWRGLVLPAVTLVVLVLAVFVLRALLNGGDFTPLSLGQELGIVRQP